MRIWYAVTFVLALTACGGGGGDSGPLKRRPAVRRHRRTPLAVMAAAPTRVCACP